MIDQMPTTNGRSPSESLFLNMVSYENERLGAYVRKLTRLNRAIVRRSSLKLERQRGDESSTSSNDDEP